ncbi:MAG TPA: hypothetical protein PLP73_00965 [Candidatus Absconditabacterales bacterium]|nr:hypothetical protein [Candidatus Absconditabacterales bacterium]HRU50196.1 hypothetical protein [Candidatus Absconditabacterales bacterium]
MKKLISFVLGGLVAISLFGFSFSDSILNYLNNIGDNILFGYKPNVDTISVDNISSTSITIKSPVLKDEFGDIITNYTLLYGPNTLNQLIAEPTLISTTKEKNFTDQNISGQSNFTMNLTTSDNINPDNIYYLVSIPKDSANTLGEVSNELCFRLRDKLHGEGDECADSNMHAAGADMSLANISHTLNGNTVTLRWIAVNGSDNVDLFLRDENAGNFNKLATVRMSAESYSFNLSKNGEHIVKFIPDNGGKEINYTFNFIGEEKVSEPEGTAPQTTVKPVVVGPKENIIAVLIGTVLLYLVYKLVRRKA